MLELEAELLLNGHHDPVVGTALIRSELHRLPRAIQHVHDAVVKGMNEGKDLCTLQQEIGLPPNAKWARATAS